MLTCKNCKREFELQEASGAAGVTADGCYVGRCPWCDHHHEANGCPHQATHYDEEVTNLVWGLELAGDNLCQRVVDLLWERNWRARHNGVMQ